MRLALLAPLPPEQSGIADYADAWMQALAAQGVEVLTPLRGRTLALTPQAVDAQMRAIDWSSVDVGHAELGGGRGGEFLALEWLARHQPQLPLTATVHDPERLIWRPVELPGPLAWARHLPRQAYQGVVLLADPLMLMRERHLAARMARLVTLTETGATCLSRRMRLPAGRVAAIAHGNQVFAPHPLSALPPQGPLRLLYFGFIYRGKGIEDLLDALALLVLRQPQAREGVRLTLAGGTGPDMAFGSTGSYLDELRARLKCLGLPEGMVDWRLDVPPGQIAPLIQEHHVMVLPYRESKKLAWLGQMRGTSGALSWAAACGRSVVSSDARAFAEEVSHGNGAVYPQGDSAALAAELERVWLQPGLLAERSEQARLLGQARAWPRMAARFKALFDDVTSNAGKGC